MTDDELIDQATEIVRTEGASPALLQRRLRISHDHAVRILGRLEERGVVPAQAAPSSPSDTQNAIVGFVVLALLIGGGWWFLFGRGDTASAPDSTQDRAHITGEFIRWEPVDDARGWAYFTLTNSGSTAEMAECTITVRNDFGNFGVDILSGERVEAGETINRRLAMSVGEGARLINQGSVEDC